MPESGGYRSGTRSAVFQKSTGRAGIVGALSYGLDKFVDGKGLPSPEIQTYIPSKLLPLTKAGEETHKTPYYLSHLEVCVLTRIHKSAEN